MLRAHQYVLKSFFISCACAQPTAADNLERLGDALQILTPAYSLYASNKINGKEGLLSCGKAIGITMLSTHALKFATDAPRPNGGGRGFPSGHTSSASVGFGCMLGQEGWSTKTITLGAASLITGYSRVDSEHHTWKQVGAGFALGAAVGYFSTKHLNKNSSLEYDFSSNGMHYLNFKTKF